jgi:hypothetical protein
MSEAKNIDKPTKKAWSIGVVVSRFISWYKTDDSGIMPTPSNAQWFWMGVIAVTCTVLKILQELDLLGVWVIS